MRRSFSFLFLAACTSTTEVEPAAAPPAVPPIVEPAACDDGTCELRAASTCAAGTRPAVGRDDCVGVGVATCATGFRRDPSGYGCQAKLLETSCTGATREAIGLAACVPVGDCDAAFPPAGAILVDPASETGPKTLAAALAMASAGATIALVDGTHVVEPTDVTRDVTIVGRCASRVVLAPSDTTSREGLGVSSKLAIRGVTMSGFFEALRVGGNGDLDATDLIIDDAHTAGITVNAGHAELARVVVRGTESWRSDMTPYGLLATNGASVTVSDSAFDRNFVVAIAVTETGTTFDMARSIVRDTVPSGALSLGMRVSGGPRVGITESVFSGSVSQVLLMQDAASADVVLTRSAVQATRPPTSGSDNTAFGIGLLAGSVTLDGTTISDTVGTALLLQKGSTAHVAGSAIVGTRHVREGHLGYALLADGATASVAGTAIFDTDAVGVSAYRGGDVSIAGSLVGKVSGVSSDSIEGGVGLMALEGSTITANDVAVLDARELGVVSQGTSDVRLDHVIVSSANQPRGTYGHALIAVNDARLDATSSIVAGYWGVGLFYAQARGTVSGSLVRGNGVGAHVQEGSRLDESDDAPESPARTLLISTSTHFVDNEVRVGEGELPLPVAP